MKGWRDVYQSMISGWWGCWLVGWWGALFPELTEMPRIPDTLWGEITGQWFWRAKSSSSKVFFSFVGYVWITYMNCMSYHITTVSRVLFHLIAIWSKNPGPLCTKAWDANIGCWYHLIALKCDWRVGSSEAKVSVKLPSDRKIFKFIGCVRDFARSVITPYCLVNKSPGWTPPPPPPPPCGGGYHVLTCVGCLRRSYILKTNNRGRMCRSEHIFKREW